MVLQMAPAQANVWGFSPNVDDDVTIRLDETEVATVKSVARSDGEPGGTWSTLLPAESAGGPTTITVTSDNITVSLNDVMFGDVWVCSGQSNMDFYVQQVNKMREYLIYQYLYIPSIDNAYTCILKHPYLA